MPVDWRDYIESRAIVLRGKPHIKGTRIPVSLILGYLAAGHSAEEIVAACLDYARSLSEFEVAV